MAKRKIPRPYDTIDALMEAMQSENDIQLGDEGAYTTLEFAARLQISRNAVLKILHALEAEGKLEVCKVKRKMLDGVSRLVVAYRVRI